MVEFDVTLKFTEASR